jgi:integral membrane sensor domain MASE1
VLCLWADQSEFMAIFMVFNLWIGPGFIFESCG